MRSIARLTLFSPYISMCTQANLKHSKHFPGPFTFKTSFLTFCITIHGRLIPPKKRQKLLLQGLICKNKERLISPMFHPHLSSRKVLPQSRLKVFLSQPPLFLLLMFSVTALDKTVALSFLRRRVRSRSTRNMNRASCVATPFRTRITFALISIHITRDMIEKIYTQ